MDAEPSVATVWTVFGIVGGIIFYSRFYVQWIYSEIKKRSVVPIAFWYMSSVGSLMLLTYAFASQSPLGALGQSFNIVVYSRNLVHIWREQGRLTPALNRSVHVVAGVIATIAMGLVATTWWREYQLTNERPVDEVAEVWLWLVVGVIGQGLFAGRFIVQWIATEMKRKSVIPSAFWYLSIVAAILQASAFFQRQEWVFAVGSVATILIYARNVWFVRRGKGGEQSAS